MRSYTHVVVSYHACTRIGHQRSMRKVCGMSNTTTTSTGTRRRRFPSPTLRSQPRCASRPTQAQRRPHLDTLLIPETLPSDVSLPPDVFMVASARPSLAVNVLPPSISLIFGSIVFQPPLESPRTKPNGTSTRPYPVSVTFISFIPHSF
jgi:hypothetical protein